MPPSRIARMITMMVIVRWALRTVGFLKAVTPLLTASTPVMAVQPLAKARSKIQRPTAAVGGGGGGVGGEEKRARTGGGGGARNGGGDVGQPGRARGNEEGQGGLGAVGRRAGGVGAHRGHARRWADLLVLLLVGGERASE